MITPISIEVSEVLPITEPVTLLEAKAFIGVDYADHDTLLTSILLSARQDIEHELHLTLVPSEVEATFDTTKEMEEINIFPYAMKLGHVSNLVVSLMEDGEDDEVLTVNEDYYYNGSLKISAAGRSKLEYTVTPVVPETIKEAIKMLVAYRFNNRGDQELQHGVPADIEAKIKKFRHIYL